MKGSLMATTEAPFAIEARSTRRPMRPNPLIPIFDMLQTQHGLVRHDQHVGVGQQRLHNTVHPLEQIEVGFAVRIPVFELVLVAPGELLREALLDFLVHTRVDLVQIFDRCPRSRDVLDGVDGTPELRCPNLREEQ
uniref:Uncharacterized protein n=1 Tax=Anopheles atroparvus TaxID=41427 RepID=A0A182IWZ9_ANOAO